MRHAWRFAGREWSVCPAAIEFVLDQVEVVTFDTLRDELLAHVAPGERDDLYGALLDDEDLDFDVLSAMVDSIRQLVYGMPYPTVLTLWDQFLKHRLLIHGRLIFGGKPKGIEGLTSYDAAALGLVLLDEGWVGLPGRTFNPEGRETLDKNLNLNTTTVTDSAMDELKALTASLVRTTPDPPPAAVE